MIWVCITGHVTGSEGQVVSENTSYIWYTHMNLHTHTHTHTPTHTPTHTHTHTHTHKTNDTSHLILKHKI